MIRMNSYYITKDKHKNELVCFSYDEDKSYSVKPKVKEKGAIEVNKIVFIKPEFSEKIIRKKIDAKIDYLLNLLREIDDSDDSEGIIKKSLIQAEKLRVQIINHYVKYLGHTYGSLTLRKIQLIIEQLRYKLYLSMQMEEDRYYEEENKNRKGR